MANDQPGRPDKSITLEESGKTLTMTYVVFNDVLRYVGSIEEAMTSIMTNQDVRDLIIRRLMTDNKKPVSDMKDLCPIEDVDIDIFELDEVLSWVVEHITYFFMRTASSLEKSMGKFPQVAEMMKKSSSPSETGSTPSPTKTKSAGRTK